MPLPLNTFKNKAPFTGKIKSVERIVGPNATGETCHIIIEHGGKMPFWEGQSYGVIPPGTKVNSKGKEVAPRRAPVLHRVHRYGDEFDGQHRHAVRAPRHLLGPREERRGPGEEGHLLQLPVRRQARRRGDDDRPHRAGDAPPRGPRDAGDHGGHGHRHRADALVHPPLLRRGRQELGVQGPRVALHGRRQLGREAVRRRVQRVLKRFPGQFRVDYALSREQNNCKGGKMYIQDKVEEYKDQVFQLLDGGAHMYFCGLKGMMPGILEMLEGVCKEKGITTRSGSRGSRRRGSGTSRCTKRRLMISARAFFASKTTTRLTFPSVAPSVASFLCLTR